MKKLKYVLVSVFTLILGVLLSACDFKNPSVNFSQTEKSMLIGDTLDVSNFIDVENVNLSDIGIEFSNDNLATNDGFVITAKNYGVTMVYAVYKNNALASFTLTIKKPFETVNNIKMSDTGLITWSPVYDTFNGGDLVKAKDYIVSYNLEHENGEVTSNSETVIDSTSYQLPEEYGVYTLSVSAVGMLDFSNSPAVEKVFYYGYMESLSQEAFAFNTQNGELSWQTEMQDAYYDLDFYTGNEVEATIKKIDGKKVSLAEILENTTVGEHTVSLLAYDKRTTNKRISSRSEQIKIVKLPTANKVYNDGKLSFLSTAPTGVASIDVFVDDVLFESYAADTLVGLKTEQTSFVGIAGGEHIVSAVIKAKEGRNGTFYANGDKADFEIVKLDKVTIAAGSNIANSPLFNYTATVENSLAPSKLQVEINGKVSNTAGFSVGVALMNASVDLSRIFPEKSSTAYAGEYEFKIFNRPNQNQIDGKDIIDSDVSDSLSFIKLGTAKNAGHLYNAAGRSVISFDEIENADKYTLSIATGDTAEPWEEIKTSTTANFNFTGKLEELYSSYFNGINLKFKIDATCDDGIYIASSTDLTLSRLTVLGSTRTSYTNVYSWNETRDAGEYVIRYKVIDDKTTYTTYAANPSAYPVVDETGFVSTTTTTSSVTLNTSLANYYYIEIYALPSKTAKSSKIASTVFKDMFYVTETLEIPEINLGFNEAYKGDGVYTFGSGYYLSIENVKYANKFTIKINSEAPIPKAVDALNDQTVYGLPIAIMNLASSGSITISIFATSDDDTIKLESGIRTLKIQKLATPVYTDFVMDIESTKLTLPGGKTGVSAIELYESGTQVKTTTSPSQSAVFDLTDVTTSGVDVVVRYIGNHFDSSTKFYDITSLSETMGIVYLDSDEKDITTDDTVFNIARTATPTELQFYNGNVKVKYGELVNNEYFVLEFEVVAGNNSDRYNLIIAYEGTLGSTANVQVKSSRLGDELTTSTLRNVNFPTYDGEYYLFDLPNLIARVCENPEMAPIYQGASDLTIRAFVYEYSLANSNEITISSNYATLLHDVSSNDLKVEKLDAPTNLKLTYEYNADSTLATLSWSAISTSFAGTTTYDVYRKDGAGAGILVASGAITNYSFTLSDLDTSKDYTFYVSAKNNSYIASPNSENLVFRLISPVSTISLSGNSLSFTTNALDASYISGYYIKTSTGDFTIGKNESFDLSGYTGEIKVKAVGAIVEHRYNISSLNTSFYVADITSLATVDGGTFSKAITYQDLSITFNTLAGNLSALKYYIVIRDSKATNTGIYTIPEFSYPTNTSLSYTYSFTNSDKAQINNLSDGNLAISVHAVVENYSISAGGYIYYDSTKTTKTQIANGNSYYNVYSYTATNSTKLSTPTVSTKFVTKNASNIYVEDNTSTTPDVMLLVKGNYSTSTDRIYVYLGSTENATLLSEGYTITGETTEVVLSNADITQRLSLGATLDIFVVVKSTASFEASPTKVTIYRNRLIKSVVANEGTTFAGFDQSVTISFEAMADSTYAQASNLNVVFSYLEYGSATPSTYIDTVQITTSTTSVVYSLSTFISTKMQKGGSFTISVNVNSFADATTGKYYMASLETSAEYSVLQKLNATTEVRVSTSTVQFAGIGGYNDTEGQTLRENLIYRVLCNYDNIYYDSTCLEAGYFLEIKDNWAGTITLTITACAEGYIRATSVDYTYTIERANAVQDISITRNTSNLDKLTISWTKPNTIADVAGYQVDFYFVNPSATQLVKTISIDNKDTTTLSVDSLYEDIGSEFSSITNPNTETRVKVAITTLGKSGKIKSKAVEVNLTRYALIVVYQIQDGMYSFSTVSGQTYLYRVVAGSNENQVAVDWTPIVATGSNTIIDLSQNAQLKSYLTSAVTNTLKVQVLKVGDMKVDGTPWKLSDGSSSAYIDSPTVTLDMFCISNKVDQVRTYSNGVGETDGSYLLKIESENPEVFRLVVSTCDSYSLMTPQNSIELKTGRTDVVNIFTVDAMKIISTFADAAAFASGKLDVYFYILKDEDGYIASQPYKYTFNLKGNVEITDIAKVETIGQETTESGLGTYVMFGNGSASSTTKYIGFYVKLNIESLMGTTVINFPAGSNEIAYQMQGGVVTLDDYVLVSYAYLKNGEYISCELVYYVPYYTIKKNLEGYSYQYGTNYTYSNYYGINLTEILKQSGVPNGAGEYNVSISAVVSENSKVSITNYITTILKGGNRQNLNFVKLYAPDNVYMREGNLYWLKSASVDVAKYNIYVELKETPTLFKILQVDDFLSDPTGRTLSYYGENLSLDVDTDYYIAISAVSTNNNVFEIDSSKTYIFDKNANKMTITKYGFASEVVVENGAFMFNWSYSASSSIENDIYAFVNHYVDHPELIFSGVANSFLDESKVFKYPFDFCVRDLLDGKYNMKFRFTKHNENSSITRYTVTFDAIYLFKSFNKKENQINTLFENLKTQYSGGDRESALQYFEKFKTYIINSLGGIGTYKTPFDDIFESIQAGVYEIEYCRTGSDNAVSSSWNKIKTNGQSNFFINNSVSVSIGSEIQQVSDIDVNAYYLKFRPVSYTTYEGATQKTVDATTYYLKMSGNSQTIGFKIFKAADKWYCSVVSKWMGFDQDAIENRYELKFYDGFVYIYLNLNNKSSLKSKFNSVTVDSEIIDLIINGYYQAEIFMQGDSHSLSSKTSVNNVKYNTALANLYFENGTMYWTSELNTATNIFIKNTDTDQQQQVEVRPISAISQNTFYSMNDQGAGEYEYLKFISYGAINQNSVTVDSDLFVLENIYKLNQPKVTTSLNDFVINDADNSKYYGYEDDLGDYIEGAYSENYFASYKIYNGVRGSGVYLIYNNSNLPTDINNNVLYNEENLSIVYEPGITGIDSSNEDYKYRVDEANAYAFYFTALGSSITNTNVTTKKMTEAEGNDYFQFEIAYSTERYVALCSTPTPVNAKMLNGISESSNGVEVNDGLIVWDYIQNNQTGNDIVYRVTISFYNTTNSSTSNFVQETNKIELVKYTTNKYFDLTQFEDELPTKKVDDPERPGQKMDVDDFEYIGVTVQVLNLTVDEERPFEGKYIELVEGGYAYGDSLTYKASPSDSNIFGKEVLISNGTTLDNIVHSDRPMSVKMYNGQLTWKYENTYYQETGDPQSPHVQFAVKDVNSGLEIAGTTTYRAIDDTYIFTFADQEQDGKTVLGTGKYELCVYANVGRFSQAQQGTTLTIDYYGIMSRASKSVQVVRLPELEDQDYVITAKTRNTETGGIISYDEVDFSGYFNKIEDFFRDNYEEIYQEYTVLKANGTYASIHTFLLAEHNLQLGLYLNDSLTVISGKPILNVGSNSQHQSILSAGSTVVGAITVTNEPVVFNTYVRNNRWINGSDVDYIFTQSFKFTLTFNRPENNTIINWDATSQMFRWTSLGDNVTYSITAYYYEYRNGNANTLTETRYYENITTPSFTPTLANHYVTIYMTAKVGDKGLTSDSVSSLKVHFSLYNSGEGTADKPYIISQDNQFVNIKYRLQKESYLNNYKRTANSVTKNIEETGQGFHFKVTSDINVETSTGVVIPGDFYGTIYGDTGVNDVFPTITYTSYGQTRLTNYFTINAGTVSGLMIGQTSMEFNYGAGLFECIKGDNTLGDRSYSVRNLNISANINSGTKTSAGYMESNKYVAAGGLAVKNEARVQQVNITAMQPKYNIASSGMVIGVVAYGGIAAYNSGTIDSCTNSASISISDQVIYTQNIFFGGICYTSIGTISNCVFDGIINFRSGSDNLYPTQQIAGICVTSTSYNSNNFINNQATATAKIRIQNEAQSATIYVGGIAIYVQNSENNGSCAVEIFGTYEGSPLLRYDEAIFDPRTAGAS